MRTTLVALPIICNFDPLDCSEAELPLVCLSLGEDPEDFWLPSFHRRSGQRQVQIGSSASMLVLSCWCSQQPGLGTLLEAHVFLVCFFPTEGIPCVNKQLTPDFFSRKLMKNDSFGGWGSVYPSLGILLLGGHPNPGNGVFQPSRFQGRTVGEDVFFIETSIHSCFLDWWFTI